MAERIRRYALSLPEAYEEHPWGESVAKVKGKVFVFLGRGADTSYSFSVKLPDSGGFALGLPIAKPTGYGLGKAGWVSISLTRADMPPLAMLKEWIDESYRAISPKHLSE